jgi:hypothetical protein
MHVSFYQQQLSHEHHYFAASFVLFNHFTLGPSKPLGISPHLEWIRSHRHQCFLANNNTNQELKVQGKKKIPCIFKSIFLLMIFYFFNFTAAGRSAQLGMSPPPEWMESRWHHRPVANNNTKKAEKGQGTKPCPQHFQPHYRTNEFLFFQLHHCRAVRTIGDISAPRMNGKPATPSPCRQQQYQEGRKRARYETMPSTFSTPLSH